MKTLLAKLLGISRQLLEWLLPILRDSAVTALEELLPVALKIVASLSMDSTKGGAEKRAKAVDLLREEAKLIGVNAASSLLNLTVEMAVARLKAGGGSK